MNIAFDVHPLISDVITGIGYCEAGLINALTTDYPNNRYFFEYFAIKNKQEKINRLKPYFKENCMHNTGFFSGFAYRAAMNFVPIPYSLFFGRKADITHFFNYIIPPGVHGKRVVTVHDMVYKAFPETMRTRTRRLLETGLEKSMKRADMIVTDSEFSMREIAKYFPRFKEKIRVVPCGVDSNRFYPIDDESRIEAVKQKLGIESEYFLYLGTIEPRKNLERLIEAYNEFRNNAGTGVPKLVLAGGKGWLYESIFQKVEELGLKDSVLFTQYIASEDMCPLMNGALAFVFPSVYEGFGMPPLEAMACKTPVLTSTEASLPEIVGDCAVLVDAYSVKSIADGLGTLYSDKDLRSNLSARGYERSKQFTWSNAGKKLYSVYEEVLK